MKSILRDFIIIIIIIIIITTINTTITIQFFILNVLADLPLAYFLTPQGKRKMHKHQTKMENKQKRDNKQSHLKIKH